MDAKELAAPALLLAAVFVAALLVYNYARLSPGDGGAPVRWQQGFSLPALQAAFRDAVADAEHATQQKVYRNLTRITPDNPALSWNGRGQVLVVTWTSYAGYDHLTGREVNLSREAWVSADSDVKSFCDSIPGGANRSLRMEEAMGLPPANGKTRFVQMFAYPSDIFRPCPDPEITDSECGLEFPENAGAEHRAWFNNLSAISYLENGYPWTRLGYTYDWGGTGSHVGLSEFVVRKGATVAIHNVSGNEYC